MCSFFSRTLAGAAAALLLVVAPLSAQQVMPPPQQELPDSIQEMIAEFQEKQERFEALQARAIQSSEGLQLQQAGIQERIQEAMRVFEPQTDELIVQLQAMQAQAQEAQEAEDMERLQQIVMEAQAVEGRLQQAQAQAFEDDEIQEAIETFQADLMTEMLQIDPEAEELLERLEELAERISDGMPTR